MARKKLSAGAVLSAMRTKHTMKCEQCGTRFTALNPLAKYCGNTCKCTAYRLRRRAAVKKVARKRAAR